MNVQDFARKKRDGVPISMVTCYDSWSAALIAETDAITMEAEHSGCEIACVPLGQDEKARVVADQMQAIVLDAKIPADPAITRRAFPRGRGKAQ